MSRQRREPSNVFSRFEPAQIQQFKEAFNLIDNDRDGDISEHDLRHILASLGITPTPTTLNALLHAHPASLSPHHPSSINFTMFLTMMSDRLCQFDPEPDLIDAFESFDEADAGTVKVDEMRKWLAEVGDRMDQHEIDKFLSGSFTDRNGNFNYREWIKILRVNDDPDSHA